MANPKANHALSVILDAAEQVVAQRGIGSLTLDSVAAQAGISKGGLLHHFPSKDALVEAMVTRQAECWRTVYRQAYEQTAPGPGRMSRAILTHCLSDAKCWTEELRSGTSAVFAALAQNPSLIQPMRAVYEELHAQIADDGLPPGVGEAVIAAIDGLWLDWVLGLVPLDQARVVRVRLVLEALVAQTVSPKPKVKTVPRSKSVSVRNSKRKK